MKGVKSMSKSSNNNKRSSSKPASDKEVFGAKDSSMKESGSTRSRGKLDARTRDKASDDTRRTRMANTGRTTGNGYASTLMELAGRFSFFVPLGNKQTLSSAPTALVDREYMVPGILSSRLMPSIGISDGPTSPLNMTVTSMFIQINNKLSKITQVEQSDIMMYIMAMDSLYTWYMYGATAYGIAHNTQMLNRYMPRGLVTAYGWDFDALVNERNQFIDKLDYYRCAMDALYVPGLLPIIGTHLSRISQIYTDDQILKSQLYVYRPDGYYTYESVAQTTGGSLQYHTIPYNISGTSDPYLLTPKEYYKIMDAMLAKLPGDQDVAIISSYLLSAYGPEAAIHMPYIPVDYAVTPQYNPAIVRELANTVYNGYSYGHVDTSEPTALDRGDIVQKDNLLYFNPRFVHPAPGYTYSWVVDASEDVPTPDTVYMYTMLTNIAKDETYVGLPGGIISWLPDNSGWTHRLDAAGCEIATTFEIWQMNVQTGFPERVPAPLTSQDQWLTYVAATTNTSVMSVLSAISKLQKFDWQPRLIAMNGWALDNSDLSSYSQAGDLAPLHNYAVFTANDLRKLHEAALVGNLNLDGLR